MKDRLKDLLADVSAIVDARLDELLPKAEQSPERLHEAMRWSVFAGGKRFRPALVFASGQYFDVSPNRLSTTAAAVEMIHTFSLIHDDLPAMDDDDLRRGQPTCHVKFDEATAILAGDALQSLAFYSIATDTTLLPEMRLRLVEGLASATGTPRGMVAGQQLDLDAEFRSPHEVDVAQVHRLKTGALITFSVISGALIGGADLNELDKFIKFAEELGLLFQITDDILDISQTTEGLGKTAGKDLNAGKATYASIYGHEGALKQAVESYERAIATISDLSERSWPLRDICEATLHRSN